MAVDHGVSQSTPSRRAPYADNPDIGARGLRTQQQILDAALQVFAEQGYERATLDRIAQSLDCTRVSLYQYFSGKDDIFRHLAGQLAQHMAASTAALGTITPDEQGVLAIRQWVGRYADTYLRFQPIFRVFIAAAQDDAVLAAGAQAISRRSVATICARLQGAVVHGDEQQRAVELVLGCVNRAFDVVTILRVDAPQIYTPERVEVAIAQAIHRALFGQLAGVNSTAPTGERAPRLAIHPAFVDLFARVRLLEEESTRADRRKLAALLAVGDEVIARCGCAGTRVADIVAAAGVSHGSFYRYFPNVDDYVLVIASRALNSISSTLIDLPDVGDPGALRSWLGRYAEVQSANLATMRVWSEAVDRQLRDQRSGIFDWGRRRLLALLRGRGFGDADIDAVVLMAMIETIGSARPVSTYLDVALGVVQRGFLAAHTD